MANKKKIDGHEVPGLLLRFEAWFTEQPAGSLGIEAVHFEPIYEGWDPELTPQLRKAGFVFFTLGEGSMVCTLRVGNATPVVLLDSEGGYRLLADSIEGFFVSWSKGQTGIHEVDDTEDYDGIGKPGKAALAAWIKGEKLKPPKATDFDLDRYLSGDAPPAAAVAAPAPRPVAGLPAEFARMVDLVGRRGDDPVVEKTMADTFGKKVPSTTAENDSDFIEKKGAPVGVGFGHEVHHDLYPPIAKTKRAFIPYVTEVQLEKKKWKEPLPFGLTFDADEDALTAALGAPVQKRAMLGDDDFEPRWSKPLDPARGVVLVAELDGDDVSLRITIPEAYDLIDPALIEGEKYIAGLFVAWAISRGLLDEARFPAHQALVADIRARKAQGSALVEAAMSRGLWDDYFHDVPGEAGLRDRLWHYFADEPTFEQDLMRLFGKAKGPHGHDTPKLPTDEWAVVDKATPMLDERLAPWLGKKS